jgi:hypothetical protein
MKQSFAVLLPARSHRINVQLCSHGRACPPWRVSPCWMEQRHESASIQRGGYYVYETHPWFVVTKTGGTPAAAPPSTGDLRVQRLSVSETA